eukprot:4914271-Alexandrium_andersonii.AAC.1
MGNDTGGQPWCPHCRKNTRPTWDHFMWHCERFDHGQRPEASLTARMAWPAREEGYSWTGAEITE